ncbi:MAG: hypothetical protein K6D96_07030 [Acetatifactor sp.]|nr:hypothetical protein [Acetatifactor sp.]
MEDRIDIKEILILLKNKLLFFGMFTLICGFLGLFIRLGYCVIFGPGTEYVYTETFLVEYGTDPQVGQSYTYINAATWDRIMDMDSFVEMVMAESSASGLTDGEIRASLSADLATDLRIPNIEVRNSDEKKAEQILISAGSAFVKYGDLRKEIDSIEVTDTTGPEIDKNIDRLPQAFILGLIVGVIICGIYFSFKYILIDGIYTLKKASERFGKPAVAAFDKNGEISDLEKNALGSFLSEKKTCALFLDADLDVAKKTNGKVLETLGNMGITAVCAKNAVELKNDTDQAEKTYFFMIKSGETSIGHVKNTMDNLEALGLNIDAICIFGADPKFIKGYRGGRK